MNGVSTARAFAACVRIVYFGRKRQVRSQTVTSMLTAIGETIKLVHQFNLLKDPEKPDRFQPRLVQTLHGWCKADPASKKMLPVEMDVPELIVTEVRHFLASEKDRTVGDWTLIAFYYLLQIGK